jgi:hypothetical protein
MSTTIIQRCDELREHMKPLGDQLDELDAIRAANGGRWTDQQRALYRVVDAQYDKLFDELFDLDEATASKTF